MRSKFLGLMALALFTVPFVTTCGSGPFNDDEKYQIGRRPEFYSAAYLWHGGDANVLVAFEKESRTLQQFQIAPFEHQLTLEVPLKYEKQGIVAGAGGGYFITMAESEYAIVKRDGSYLKNPVPMLGQIKSIAFSPDQHLAVITDDFQTIIVLILSSGGDILGSYKSGGNVVEGKLALSGTMMADGRLVLALGETTIAVADLKKTVAEGGWRFAREPFEVAEAKSMSWMSSMPDGGDVVMVADEGRLLSINVATGVIVDQKDMTNVTVRGYYRDYTPHVVHQTGTTVLDQQHQISYLGTDGKFITKSMLSNPHQITATWLDPAADLFTIVYDPGKDHIIDLDFDDDDNSKREIYRFRPSDSAGLDRSDTPSRAKLIVTPGYLMLLYESVLGKAERRGYGLEPGTLSLKGYNLQLLKDRYSDDD